MNTWQNMIQFVEKASFMKKQYFLEQVLGSYQWWLLLGMAILPWVTWGLLVCKPDLRRIVLTGFFTATLTSVFDEIGVSLSFWAYPYQLVYFTSWLIPVNLAVIPVAFMLFYQYFRTWKTYMMMVILFSLFAALIAEPVFDRMHIAVVIHWKYVYSPPFYIAIGACAKWLADEIGQPKQAEKEQQQKER